MKVTQHVPGRAAVIVLIKGDGAADGGLKALLIEAFEEETAFSAELGGLDDFDAGNRGVDDVHVSLVKINNWLIQHRQQIAAVTSFLQRFGQ